MTDDPRIYLRDTGHVYVTFAAADRFARARGVEVEAARKALTAWLLEATRVADSSTGAETWRRRKRSEDLDVSATVVREPPLAVVVSVSVRGTPRR